MKITKFHKIQRLFFLIFLDRFCTLYFLSNWRHTTCFRVI